MRKKQSFLDLEAMKIGFHSMLQDVMHQLNEGHISPSIRAVLADRKTHIERRLEELAQP